MSLSFKTVCLLSTLIVSLYV